MKNYLTVAYRWGAAKKGIHAEHERLSPALAKIISEYVAISGQEPDASSLMACEGLFFYPFWGGWGYAMGYKECASAWTAKPVSAGEHWPAYSLKVAENVLVFMQSLHEEELKILFRRWSEASASARGRNRRAQAVHT